MGLKVLLTGASGSLGKEVREYFPKAMAPSHAELDLCDAKETRELVREFEPDVIIHMAGLANVRLCEQEKELAWQTNVTGTENLVNACKENPSHPFFLYPSTPCVFKGDRGGYSEGSRPDPQNYYGETKYRAERIVLAYENSLVFRKNFVPRSKWKYEAAFVDRYGTYLFADELACVISQLPTSGLRGVLHITGRERISMYELARVLTPEVKPITMKEMDLTLTVDMSIMSNRIEPFSMVKSLQRPKDYGPFKLTLKAQSTS